MHKLVFPKKRGIHAITGTDIVMAIIAIVIGFVTIYPMWYVICMSLSSPQAMAQGTVYIWPDTFRLDSYKIVFKNNDLWNGLLMSLFNVRLMVLTQGFA